MHTFRFCLLTSLLFLGTGCGIISSKTAQPTTATTAIMTDITPVITKPIDKTLTLPIQGFAERQTIKLFDQWVSDRFTGYHLGEDIEYTDTDADVPVYSIATGTVRYIGAHVNGYGGVLEISYTVDDEKITALYGHLNLVKTALRAGQTVGLGQTLAYLGKGFSTQTDGERKHLHFGLYTGSAFRINGYTKTKADMAGWLNPDDFFKQHGLLQ